MVLLLQEIGFVAASDPRFLGILGLSERGFVNITPQIATQTIRMVTRRAFR
jgi:hypothetical protein